MHILHVVPTYLPAWRYGGPIRSVHALCVAQLEEGHDVQVLTTNVNGDENLLVPVSEAVNLDKGLTVNYCSVIWRRTFLSVGMWRFLWNNHSEYDVFHLHSVFLFPTTMAALIARIFKIPYVISPRGLLMPEMITAKGELRKKLWISIFERRNLRYASAVHATSNAERHGLELIGVPSSLITVIRNGVPLLEEVSPENNKPYDDRYDIPVRPYLLYLGRLNWKKGIDKLIRAMVDIDEYLLYVVGNSEDEYGEALEGLVRELKLIDRVRFLGEVVGPAKSLLYREAELFVLPSRSENFGNVVLEALMEGCPVAVTRGVGLAEIVEKEGLGIIIDSDPAQMAMMIKGFLSNKNLTSQIRRCAAEKVSNIFSWHSISREFTAVYERAIELKCLPSVK